MNTVEVRITSWLGDVFLGQESKNLTLQIEADDTIIDLLNKLVAEDKCPSDVLFNAEGRLRGYVRIIINGRFMELLDGLKTKLHNGDKVMLLPNYAGG
ncbi:MAG: MoaD/ThiS family protein [Candidatus Poribacteria bacterium]